MGLAQVGVDVMTGVGALEGAWAHSLPAPAPAGIHGGRQRTSPKGPEPKAVATVGLAPLPSARLCCTASELGTCRRWFWYPLA